MSGSRPLAALLAFGCAALTASTLSSFGGERRCQTQHSDKAQKMPEHLFIPCSRGKVISTIWQGSSACGARHRQASHSARRAGFDLARTALRWTLGRYSGQSDAHVMRLHRHRSAVAGRALFRCRRPPADREQRVRRDWRYLGCARFRVDIADLQSDRAGMRRPRGCACGHCRRSSSQAQPHLKVVAPPDLIACDPGPERPSGPAEGGANHLR